MDTATEIWVRATINMAGLARGQEVLVDPAEPYIAAALENTYLIAIDAPWWAGQQPGREKRATADA